MQRFGKRGLNFQKQLDVLRSEGRQKALDRAKRQLEVARSVGGDILTYDHPRYPQNLYRSNLPVPLLYARGDLDVLKNDKAVACVGSRKIRMPYSELHDAFARRAVGLG